MSKRRAHAILDIYFDGLKRPFFVTFTPKTPLMGYFVRFAPLYYVIWTLMVDLPHHRSPRDGSNKGSLGNRIGWGYGDTQVKAI